MNKERRKRLKSIIERMDAEFAKFERHREAFTTALQPLIEEIEEIRDTEQDYFDNMPASFQQGDKGQVVSDAIALLDEAHSEIGNVEEGFNTITDTIGAVKEQLEEAQA